MSKAMQNILSRQGVFFHFRRSHYGDISTPSIQCRFGNTLLLSPLPLRVKGSLGIA
jgi:hypothetical protein